MAAWVALIQGDRDDAIAYLVECGEIAERPRGPPDVRAHRALVRAAPPALRRTAAAAGLYERAIAVHRGGGDTASVLLALFQVAVAQTYNGRRAGPADCTDALELSDPYSKRWNRAYCAG